MPGSGPWLSRTTRRGLGLGFVVLTGWVGSLIVLLALDLGRLSVGVWMLLVVAVLGRTLLQTGLFIVGHDAMHGVLLTERPSWNDRLGALVLLLYAGLAYPDCRHNHRCHHRFTATGRDPDFHGDSSSGPFGWYGRFMAGYLTVGQMGRLLGGWALLGLIACRFSPTGWANVLLFCTLPLLLSSLQLFLFGTFLPHRSQRAPHSQPEPDSLDLPPWLSLLACFHFGYHREHHDRPELAWFELPAHRQRLRQISGARGLAPA